MKSRPRPSVLTYRGSDCGMDHESPMELPAQCANKFEILIVDDSPVQRSLLRQMLESCGHPVIEASDGDDALRILQERKIPMVFTDWVMPRMTGIELIEKIRESNRGFSVYIILCSCRDSKTDIIEGIRAGADDFLAKPAARDELIARLHAGEQVIELKMMICAEQKELKAAYASLSQAHEMLRSDLRAAADLQVSLLPSPASFQGIEFDWVFRPASGVAGDIFNVFPIDQKHIAFYQLDVAGHGIPSAMLSFSLSKALQAAPLRESTLKRMTTEYPFYRIVPPVEVAASLNQTFQNDEGLYFTLVYGVLDVSTGNLEYVQAGHPNPFLISPSRPVQLMGGTGFPIAALPDVEYEPRQEFLRPGDRIFLTSDGAIECKNAQNEQFGVGRMTDALNRCGTLPVPDTARYVAERLLDWRGGDTFDDDLSLLTIEYTGVDMERKASPVCGPT